VTRPPIPSSPRWRRVLGSLAAAFLLWLLAIWPPPSWYRTNFPRETAFMALRDRTAPDSTAWRPRYDPVPLARMSSHLRHAVRLAEDRRFYEHWGVDFQAIREALGYRHEGFSWTSGADYGELWRAARGAWSRRDQVRGASTITQQLAKNLYLSPSRNPFRKLKEAVTAFRLEAALEKDRILELYLNVVELGPDLWGVEAASRRYYDRPAEALTPSQAAWLAATLPSPLAANPKLRPGRIRWRQEIILQWMRREPY